MAQNKKQQKALKHQRAVQRKVVRRKQTGTTEDERALLRASGNWPLHEVLVAKEWQTPGSLVQVLVARRSPSGQIAAGVCLVDLGCLGVKSAFARIFDSPYEYEDLRDNMTDRQEMVNADLNLAAKIIEEGYYYALDLGFKPDPDLEDALLVIGEADPEACPTPVPLGGPNDKPFFFPGPYDNAELIRAKLTQKLGPGGFDFMMEVPPDSEFMRAPVWEDGDDEDAENDEEEKGG